MRASGESSGGGVGNSSLRAACAGFCLALSAVAPTGVFAQAASPAPATFAGSTHDSAARQLAQSGRGADALYRYLVPLEGQYAGDPDYDYALGTSALDSGRLSHAVFVLQRAVAARPRFAGARMELARAYFELGDNESARREFAILEKDNPPPQARRAIAGYLAAIDRRAAAYRPQRSAYAELGSGYDSNANASTDDDTFLGITLNPTNVEQPSAFLTAAGWFGHAADLGGGRIETRGRLGHRWNPDAEFVDQTIASLGTTLGFGDGPTVFAVGLGGWYGLLDGDPHHWNLSLDLSLSRRFGDAWRATGMLRAGQLRYEESDFPGLSVLDMDQFLGAFSLQRAAETGHFGFTVFHGTDDERESLSPFGNDRFGAQLYGGTRGSGGNDVGFQLSWQDVDYDDTPGFFGGTDRSDTLWSAAVTMEIRDWPASGMHLVPRVGWSSNESNIALYDYDRFEAGLTLTRSFR